MADINDGGPAFPTDSASQVGATVWHHEGMSLRDHFAGLALAGMLADIPKSCYGLDWQKQVSRESYKLADAMLLARQEGSEP